jgi:hypothetical protein
MSDEQFAALFNELQERAIEPSSCSCSGTEGLWVTILALVTPIALANEMCYNST